MMIFLYIHIVYQLTHRSNIGVLKSATEIFAHFFGLNCLILGILNLTIYRIEIRDTHHFRGTRRGQLDFNTYLNKMNK